ncbi:MAG: nucleoside phosphatase GDA1/CD39 [Piptocephalis tieghemiana]|nr:MAG: nucleoside phosphatase GDA1/CD39 [Piptocephalis tieghemiana]
MLFSTQVSLAPATASFSLLYLLAVIPSLAVGLPTPNPKHYTPQLDTSTWPPQDTAYGLIIDAGSSGSRIHAYKWLRSSAHQHHIQIEPVLTNKGKPFAHKIKPGISSLRPEQVPTYMEHLIGNATQVIPKEVLSTTPIYWKATAGMRLLPQDQSLALTSAVKQSLARSPFQLDPKFGVQIISGEQEGVYGWLTLNYLRRQLSPDSSSFAALDLGGASTQITFDPVSTPYAAAYPLHANGTRYLLYTHSYLRYGADQIRMRYQQSLVSSGNYATQAPGDDQEVVAIEDPCNWKDSVELVKGSQGEDVRLIGTGEPLACQKRVHALLQQDTFCTQKPCAVAGAYQPDIPEDMRIHAVSNYAHVASFFGCDQKEGSTPKCIQDAVQSRCSTLSWKQAYSIWGPGGTDPKSGGPVAEHLHEMCLGGTYITSLLTQGYHLSLDKPIVFRDDIDGVDAGWTLGAMISEADDSTLTSYITNARKSG